MRFYTKEECAAWLRERDRAKPDEIPGAHCQHVWHRDIGENFLQMARWIADSLTYRMPVLLWITEWGIWGSDENWHLYYRLRTSYGDNRLLHEAPGHFFLDYETEDLASLLQVAMLNGWGGYVLTQADYVNVFFSHDEYLHFYAAFDDNLADVRSAWRSEKEGTE
jgi:hypothetical protein